MDAKKIFLFSLLSFFVGWNLGMLCGGILQNSKTSIPGNSSVHSGQYIDQSTITEQTGRIEQTEKSIESTNQRIEETTASIEQLLQKQQRLLTKCEQNLTGAELIVEEGKQQN